MSEDLWEMGKFSILKLIRKATGEIVEVAINPMKGTEYSYKNLGNAKAAARLAASAPTNGLEDVVVKDEEGEIVFRANRFRNGIYEK